MLNLAGRYYRPIPLNSPGYEIETLELVPARTALVTLHCWNIGCEGGLEVNDDYWVGVGFRETHIEAGKILKDRIRPAVEAARRAGILVCHVETEMAAKRRPEMSYQADPRDENPLYSPNPLATGWRDQMTERYHGRDLYHSPPYSEIDRSPLLEPLPGEPFVYQTRQFDRVLREHGIENLIYTGFATDMCILFAPGGIQPMAGFNYRIFLARDATLGVEFPDTFKERLATRWGIRYFESHFGDTIETDDFIAACQKREIAS